MNIRQQKIVWYFVGIGAIVGSVTGAVVYGVLSFATAAEGWEDVSAIAGAMFGFVGGGVVGSVAGYGWFVLSRRSPG